MKRLTVLLSFTTGCLVLICSSAVDRHRLHSLSFHEGRPRIGFSWNRGDYEVGERLEVFYTTSLTSSWKLVHTEIVREETSDVEYEFKNICPDADGGFFTVRRFVDSDCDGTSDAQEELEYHSDPFSLDSDFDTIPDEYEIAHGMNPADPDTDHDGVPDEFEIRFGSSPFSYDTDHDGISDCDEWLIYYTDLTRADTDGDFVDDLEEIERGLDPNREYSVDPRYPDRIMRLFGGCDPYSYPEGSTNMCWVHVFYSQTPDGGIVLPESTDTDAVLKMKVEGVGAGIVSVRGREYVVFGDEVPKPTRWMAMNNPSSGAELLAKVERGFQNEITVEAPDSLKITFSSDDFMIGELPTEEIYGGLHIGWVAFPNPFVKAPCIHNLGEQAVDLLLETSWWITDLTCSWDAEDSGLEIQPRPSLGARISGDLDRGTLEKVSYRLWHPKYLDGQCVYDQRVKYCLPEDEDEPDDDDDSGWGSHISGTVDDFREEDPEGHEREDADMEDDEPDPPDDDEDVETLMKMSRWEDVLILRNPQVADKIELKIPSNPEKCCDCPEHQANRLKVRTPNGRLMVLDENGVSFSETTVDRLMCVYGMAPSRVVGDALLRVECGKKICEEHKYTVLGLEIDSHQFDLKMLNSWAREMGLPVSVSSSSYRGLGELSDEVMTEGTDVELICNVGLPYGKMRLEFVDPTGHFQLWCYHRMGGCWKCVLDSENYPAMELSIGEWRQMFEVEREGSAPVRIVANSVGQASLMWTYAWRYGEKVICDRTKQLFSAVQPRLIFDYDRNGRIEQADLSSGLQGRTFRFWVNDDADKEETEEGLVDLPGDVGNCADARINGKRDFVDFTPVCVDLTDAFPEICSSSIQDAVSWRIVSDCVNVVQTGLPRDLAGAFQTQDMGESFGVNLDRKIQSAEVESTTGGCEVNPRLVRAALQGEYGVLLMEGRAPGHDLRLEGWLIGKDCEFKLMECRAKISVSKVDQMYRWIDIRQAADQSVPIRDSGLPSNWSFPMDSGGEERSFVFVHGFNVNVQEARAWAAEMYKRFWQAGFDGQFAAVDWTGDSSQFHLRLMDDNYAPDYYVNVRNAFKAAAVLPEALRNVGGRKCLLAHSLGNMLVSSSAVDHKLEYERYYMLNAAVPMEAYDSTAYAGAMVDTEWSQVPQQYWASYWGQLFDQNDFRRSLNWRGRFAGLRNVVNAYSQTEDVLGNPKEGQLTYIGGAWKIQELSKGTTTWYDINALPLKDLDVVCEGGWGINTQYAFNPRWYVYQYGFTEYAGSELTRKQAITEPLFTPFREQSQRMHSDDHFENWEIGDPAALRARFLGDAIPATSFAQGANAASPKLGWTNMSLTELADHLDSWPRGTPKGGLCEWRHSDLKNLPYFNVHKVFEKIVKGE